MEQRRRPVRRLLRLSDTTDRNRGSATVEGIAAMAVFFLLLLVVVQVGFAVTARSIVAASVDGAARRAVVGADDAELLDRLEREVLRSVPGLEITDTSILRSDTTIAVEVRYRWLPPGPDLLPIEVTVARERSVVIPP